MNDLFSVPFPIPSTGNALNSQVRINLDAIVTAINNISNGVTHFNTLSLGETNVFNGQINWYSASNANVAALTMGNNKNLIADMTGLNILSTGVSVGGNNEVEVDIQNSSSGTNLGAKLFIRAASVGQGDAYVSMIVANTTSWSLGIDNDDSDTFKISKSGSLGTNDYFKISTAGVVSLSIAPIFSGLTASTVPYLDSSKVLTSSAVTPTELGYLSGVTSAIQTQLGLKAPLASPTFTGVVTMPTPFTLGAVSVTATGTEMNYLVGVTSAIQTQFTAKAPLASPTFTGTVTIPTPFTLGAVSVTTTGTELNFVAGVTSAIQTQFTAKAPLASPTFTGTVVLPTTTTAGTFASSSTSATALTVNSTTLVVDASNNRIGIGATPTTRLTVSDASMLSNFNLTVTIADDAVADLSSYAKSGAIVSILVLAQAESSVSGMAIGRRGGTPNIVKVGGGANFDVSTATLTGTTGTDTHVTISTTATQVLLENRIGGSRDFFITIISGS